VRDTPHSSSLHLQSAALQKNSISKKAKQSFRHDIFANIPELLSRIEVLEKAVLRRTGKNGLKPHHDVLKSTNLAVCAMVISSQHAQGLLLIIRLPYQERALEMRSFI
jgi:hypothetical protein